MPQAMETFQRIKSSSPDIYAKIKESIKDAMEHPSSGLGNPTPLDGSFKGLWERRVSHEEGFYYAFDEERLVIFGFSSLVAQTSQSITLEAFSD